MIEVIRDNSIRTTVEEIMERRGIKSAHDICGLLATFDDYTYYTDTDLYMLCAIGVQTFTWIALTDGNRKSDNHALTLSDWIYPYNGKAKLVLE